jgi:signal transduction histidine kinase
MAGFPPYDVMLLHSAWIIALTVMTLIILWNARGLAVYLWCLSGLFGVIFTVLSIGPIAELAYPNFWGQPALGLTLVIGVALKAAAIKSLTPDPRLDSHLKVTGLMILTLVTAPLLDVPRYGVSLLVSLYCVVLVLWLVRDVFIASEKMKFGNAKLFGVLMGFQAVMILILSLSLAFEGLDGFTPPTTPLTIIDVIQRSVTSLVNSALFIALVLDINIRQQELLRNQLVAAETERSRLEERQQLLADMHDGFGSQLITAKMQAERGELGQPQLVDLLRESLTDLHLVLDGLRDHNGDLAEALQRYRRRTEHRLAGFPVLILWQIDLDDAPALSAKTTVNLLRIVQEALNNALKHAEASQIIVSAQYDHQDGFVIAVEDNGCGIPKALSSSSGLANMRRRARQIGAQFNLRSRDDGRGTIIEVANLHPDGQAMTIATAR